MWGGWYHDDDYMALMAQMQQLVARGMDKPVCDIALFVDEKSYAKAERGGVVSETAKALGLVGAPYDAYLTSDFDRVYQNYRACVFAKPAESQLVDESVGKASAAGKAVAVRVDTDRPVSTEPLRDFLEASGIPLYTNRKAVVYRGEKYLCLYTAEEGEYHFESDGKTTFTDLFTGETLTFPATLSKYKCFLFER